MANIYKGTLGLIGNTPLVEAVNIEKSEGLEAKLLLKLEYFTGCTGLNLDAACACACCLGCCSGSCLGCCLGC